MVVMVMVLMVALVMVLVKEMKADIYRASALHGNASVKKVSIDRSHPIHPTAVLKKKLYLISLKYLTEIFVIITLLHLITSCKKGFLI